MEFPETKGRSKSRRIVVRLKLPLYEFLEEFAKNTGRTMSDVIRNSIENFHLRLFLGENNPTTKDLKKMFLQAYGEKKKRIENLKKRNINLKEL